MTELIPYIKDAKKYYEAEYKKLKLPNQRKSNMTSLKYFDIFEELVSGADASDVIKNYNITLASLKHNIKRTALRIKFYISEMELKKQREDQPLSKSKKVVSKENLDLIRDMSCSVCMKPPPSEAHHWISRGAGGDDRLSNLVSLCHSHHHTFHQIGRVRFSNLYGDKVQRYRLWMGLPEIVDFKIKNNI